jgi:hypothetical protein
MVKVYGTQLANDPVLMAHPDPRRPRFRPPGRREWRVRPAAGDVPRRQDPLDLRRRERAAAVDRGQAADRPGCDRLTSDSSASTSVIVGQRRSSAVNVGRPGDGLIMKPSSEREDPS